MGGGRSAKQPRLAIVIPAYKTSFLREALQSIASQTCREFRVYVGDDGSPNDVKSVADSFATKIDIVFKRFETNLGGRDLVAHWERCIDMIGEEEWVWLFSDDDVMDASCVDRFYKRLAEFSNVDLFHFNVKQIDSIGNIVDSSKFPDFPENYRIEDFAHDRLLNKQQSFVVEYIFRKLKFLEVGRYQNFDLGWGSDVGTCIKLGHPTGIHTIPGAYVYWRMSNQNISPDNSKEMVDRKLDAVVLFLDWLNSFARRNRLNFDISPTRIYLRRWLSFRGKRGLTNTFKDIARILKQESAAKGTRHD